MEKRITELSRDGEAVLLVIAVLGGSATQAEVFSVVEEVGIRTMSAEEYATWKAWTKPFIRIQSCRELARGL